MDRMQAKKKFLEEVSVHSKYETLLEALIDKNIEPKLHEKESDTFTIRPHNTSVTLPKELYACGIMWRDAIEILHRYREYVRVTMVIVGWFSVDEEGRAFGDNETVLRNFYEDPMMILGRDISLKKVDGENFETLLIEDLYHRRKNLESMQYRIKKGHMQIPYSRIHFLKFSLD